MSIREIDLPLVGEVARVRGIDGAGASASIEGAVLANQMGAQMHVTRGDGSFPLLSDYLQDLEEAAGTGVLGYATKALMVAAAPTAPPDGTIRRVTNDPADVNGSINGEWRYNAAAPGDHWVKVTDSKYDALVAEVDTLDQRVTDEVTAIDHRLDFIENDTLPINFNDATEYEVINTIISNPASRYTTSIVSGNLQVNQIVTGFPFLIGFLSNAISPKNRTFTVRCQAPNVTGGSGLGICWNPSGGSSIDPANFVGIIWRQNGLVAAYRQDGTTLIPEYTAPGAVSGVVIGNDVARVTFVSNDIIEMTAAVDYDGSTVTFTTSVNGNAGVTFTVAGLPATAYVGAVVRQDTAQTYTIGPASLSKLQPWDKRLYIDPSVGASGVGTEKSPFKTLADATAYADESGRRLDLILKDGIFAGSVEVLSSRYDHISIRGNVGYRPIIRPGTMLTSGWTQTPLTSNVWQRAHVWNGVSGSLVANGAFFDYSQPDGFWGFTTYTRINPLTGSTGALDALPAGVGGYFTPTTGIEYIKTKNNLDPNTLQIFRAEYYAGIHLAPPTRDFVGHSTIEIAGIEIWNPYAHGIRAGRCRGRIENVDIWGPATLNGIATDLMSGEIASCRIVRPGNDGINCTLPLDFAPPSVGGTGSYPTRPTYLHVVDCEMTDAIVGDGYSPHYGQISSVDHSRMLRNGKCGFVPVGDARIRNCDIWDNVVGIQALPAAETTPQTIYVRGCDMRRNGSHFLVTTPAGCVGEIEVSDTLATDATTVCYDFRNDTVTGGTTTNPCKITVRNVYESGNALRERHQGGASGQVGYLTTVDVQTKAGADRTAQLASVAALAEKVIPNSIEFIDGLKMVLRFTSGTGRSFGGFSDDSYLNLFKGMRIGKAGNRTQVMPSTDPDILEEIVTSNGRIKMRLSASGTKDVNPFASGTSGAANPLGADVLFLPVYGQSLGEGAEALPALTTSPTGHRGRKFVRGVRTWKVDAYSSNPVGRPASDFVVVDLSEAQDGATGETIASAMVASLREQIIGPNSGNSRNSGPEIIVSFAGRGGRRLYQLDKAHQNDPEGKYYDTLIDDIRRAKAYAVENGKTFAVLGMVYMQGEADNDLKFNDADSPMAYADFIPAWAAAFTQLADDFDADARGITSQVGRIPVFVYQTGGTGTGQAQMVAAANSPQKVIPVGPTYFVPSAKNSSYTSGGNVVHGNEVHLSADGERWFGSLVGKCIYDYLVKRDPNVSLRAILARKVSTDEIDVVFRVPCEPIRLDTTWWPANGTSLGFRCMTGSGTSQGNGPAVTGVTVVDTDTIRLKLASAVPAGAKVECNRLKDVRNISLVVADWRDGATLPNGRPSKELAFAGDIRSQFQQHLNEGCFYVINLTTGLGSGRTWIGRQVTYTGSQTVVIGENVAAEFGSGVTAATAFAVGQSIAISRIIAYGNVFDSDPRESPLAFTDTSYSVGRVGKKYPLPNPLNAFQDLEVIGA